MQKILLMIVFFGLFDVSYLCVNAQNLKLSDALRLAKTQNPELKAARYQINLVQADSITAALRPNPIFHNETIQLSQKKNFAPNTSWSDPINRQTIFTLTKPFQLAGQRQKKLALATKQIDLSSNNYKETERQVLVAVASKWMEVYTAHKQLDILKIALDNIDSLSEINAVRLKNEVITQTDFMRTQLLANTYELKVKTEQQELHNRLIELAYLTGSKNLDDIDMDDPYAFTLNTDSNALLQQTMNNRTDIKAAQALVTVSNKNIDLQRSLAIPVPEFGFMWNPQNTINYVGVALTVDIPLFSKNQGELKKAYVQKQQSEQQYQAVKGKAAMEMMTAYASYKTQELHLQKFTDGLLEQSEQILANVKYAYLKGGTTLIDFLEAQRSWLDMQQQYYDTLQAYKQRYIELLYASGSMDQLIR